MPDPKASGSSGGSSGPHQKPAPAPAPAPIPIAAFSARQLELVEREVEAELAETGALLAQSSPAALARAGLAVTGLVPLSHRTGFGGRTVVELGRDPALAASGGGAGAKGGGSGGKGGAGQGRTAAPARELSDHSIRTGDIVAIREMPGASAKKKEKMELEQGGVEGVVVKTTGGAVWVACQRDDAEIPAGRLWIVKLANEATFLRMKQLMGRLKTYSDGQQTPLMRVLLGQSAPQIPTAAEMKKLDGISWKSGQLNESQKEAVRFALASPDVALIHGPPGTGKTHTLVELVLQLLAQKPDAKILVCGPSNVSVDNIVERLAAQAVPLVRLGHPARLLPAVVDHSLDVLTRTSDAGGIVRDVRRELDAKQASIRKCRSGRERRQVYADMKELRAEYRVRERRCVDELLAGSRVVLATLHGAGGGNLRNVRFDVAIVDEASQALEAQTWLAVQAAPKLILAGDHLQLPPTVKSANSKARQRKSAERPAGGKVAGESGTSAEGAAPASAPADSPASQLRLEVSLFDRLLDLYGPSIKRMLTVQYRMNELIMRFPSDALYGGELTADASVRDRLLQDITAYPDAVAQTEDTSEPLVFFDTQGGLFPEAVEEDGEGGSSGPADSGTARGRARTVLASESKLNELEVILSVMHAKSLVQSGVAEEDIAVISPYNGQVGCIGRALGRVHPRIEVGSVDGFQGREKEAVIVSLVRSNEEGEVGFLGERRRLNVAMTRAKRHLCVIGDSETICRGSAFLKAWMEYLTNRSDLRFPDPSDLECSRVE